MLVDGVTVPHFLYGTAWKENKTKSLVTLALDQGFRGIDTANQRKHYNEAAVGEGIREMINRGLIARKDLRSEERRVGKGGRSRGSADH